MRQLTNSVKISEKVNKITKKIYCDYRNKVLGKYTNPKYVYVCGNSKAYAESVVFPACELKKHSAFIFTRVDENSMLIGAYIIPVWAFNNQNLAWVSKVFSKNIGISNVETEKDIFYFRQLVYKDFEKYNDKKLLSLVNDYLNKENK